jgi:acyl carrier protein
VDFNGTAPLGRPFAGVRVYILDNQLQPVPAGVAGELYVGGDCLARGYLKRSDLTAARFCPNPFADEPGARLYQTGDRARFLPNGDIEFLGRLDHQVKIRGFRIELGEIESVLGQHPDVKERVVVAREDTPGDKRIVAYAVPAAGVTLNLSQVRDFLKQKLPEYMVPSAIVPLEKLPLTPNGKLDRRALPPPDQNRPDLAKAYAAPGTTTEEVLAEIWREVLGLDRIGIHDNFFELGGHSLLVTQVLARVREAFHVELPLRRLFEAPTVAELAAAVEEILVREIRELSDVEAERLMREPELSAKDGI